MFELATQSRRLSEVDQAFEKLGFRVELDQYTYVRKMETEFGRAGVKFMDAIDRIQETSGYLDSDVMRRIYRQKNKDWRLSLFVTMQDDVRKFRPLLKWLLTQDLDLEGVVVDIGCDIGALTCLLATVFPGRPIVGIDQVREAILNARVVARKKAVKNASFEVFSLGRAGIAPGFSAAMGIAPFVLQEVFRNCLSGQAPSDAERCASIQLATMIDPGGRLVSVDRLPGGHDQAVPMADLIQEAGFDLEQQDILEVPGPVMLEKFPVSVFRRVSPAC